MKIKTIILAILTTTLLAIVAYASEDQNQEAQVIPLRKLVADNNVNIDIVDAKINKGEIVTKEDVADIMGSNVALEKDTVVYNPFRVDFSVLGEAWYYYAKIKDNDGVVAKEEVTPIYFQGGQAWCIGWSCLCAMGQCE